MRFQKGAYYCIIEKELSTEKEGKRFFMAYRLAALDLDDTLLNSEKQLSPKNREALQKIIERGIRVILASGRAYPGIESYNRMIGNQDYTIACGGAQVVDPEGNVVFSTYVPSLTAKQVMRWAVTHGAYFQVYMDDGFHYLSRTPFTDYYEKHCGYPGIENPDLLEIEPVLASKILLIDEPERLEQFRSELKTVFPELALKKSQANFLEVMNPEATKGSALEFLSNKLDIEPQQIFAVGDSEIDESMLRFAGMGVAMENASEPCKLAADAITASCEEDGVAAAIEKYILGVSE